MGMNVFGSEVPTMQQKLNLPFGHPPILLQQSFLLNILRLLESLCAQNRQTPYNIH